VGGGGLVAQTIGEADVSPWLERAWRARPTPERLRRWLGAAPVGETRRRRVAAALAACPAWAERERALLLLLQGDLVGAARSLGEAPGSGWSQPEHPGELLVPLFTALLGASPRPPWGSRPGADAAGGPSLQTPAVAALLRDAGMGRVQDGAARALLLGAMRQAAERRSEAVTAERHRRRYADAAALVAAYVALDGSFEARQWAGAIRDRYRRFPAFCAELDRCLRRHRA
jgi:hypothetical protein